MAKFEYKKEVEKLRKSGASISEIVAQTGLSKSTVSLWCKDIQMSAKLKARLRQKMISSGHAGRLLGAQVNREKKEKSIGRAQEWAEIQMGILQKRDHLIAGIALYWAEGSKAGDSKSSFINSDPNMVAFMFKWYQDFFGVKKEDFICRVFINEIHRARESKVLSFWASLLELPNTSFRSTVFVQTKQRKVYSNHETYYGMLSLRIRKSSGIKYKSVALVEILRHAGVAQVVRASHS